MKVTINGEWIDTGRIEITTGSNRYIIEDTQSYPSGKDALLLISDKTLLLKNETPNALIIGTKA